MLKTWRVHSLQELTQVANEIAKEKDSVLLLEGELGSGKTTFAKAYVKARGIDAHVSSPTYTIVQAYGEEPILFHMDLYRIEEPEELEIIGFEEYLEQGTCLIEWPEVAMSYLHKEQVRVLRFHLDGEHRRLEYGGLDDFRD